MEFLGSALGEYMAQTSLYSSVLAIVVESLLRLWHISSPQAILRYRLFILVLPGVYWATYQLFHLLGDGESFRKSMAIFELNSWLSLEIWHGIKLGHLFLFLMGFTTLLFLLQEVLPIVRSRPLPREFLQPIRHGQFPKLDAVIADMVALSRPLPPLYLMERREPVAFTVGTLNPVLVLSSSLIERLDEKELKGVLAHEIAHLHKGDNWKSWILLALRCLMFFNPLALIVFRGLAQENEKICDELAVKATGEPLALASGVIKVFRSDMSSSRLSPGLRGWLLSWEENLDNKARSLAIEERVSRLMNYRTPEALTLERMRMALVAIAAFLLLYFVM